MAKHGSGVFLSVDRDGWTKGIQLSIDYADAGGYRVAGPKFNGSSTRMLRHQLSERDCDELERAVKTARAALSQENSNEQ